MDTKTQQEKAFDAALKSATTNDVLDFGKFVTDLMNNLENKEHKEQ